MPCEQKVESLSNSFNLFPLSSSYSLFSSISVQLDNFWGMILLGVICISEYFENHVLLLSLYIIYWTKIFLSNMKEKQNRVELLRFWTLEPDCLILPLSRTTLKSPEHVRNLFHHLTAGKPNLSIPLSKEGWEVLGVMGEVVIHWLHQMRWINLGDRWSDMSEPNFSHDCKLFPSPSIWGITCLPIFSCSRRFILGVALCPYIIESFPGMALI